MKYNIYYKHYNRYILISVLMKYHEVHGLCSQNSLIWVRNPSRVIIGKLLNPKFSVL